jgi:hypothetical protein
VCRSFARFDESTEGLIVQATKLKKGMTLDEVKREMPKYIRWEFDGTGDGLGREESYGFRWQEEVFAGFQFQQPMGGGRYRLISFYVRRDREAIRDGEATVVKSYRSPFYVIEYSDKRTSRRAE